jgi:CubicO group peptidase (beta-lactamase class C family)
MLTNIGQILPRTSPEQQGTASAAILQFVEALDSQIREIHSLMLLRHGSVVAEAWWSPYAPEHPHMVFSVSKSFTSTAVGLALDEGRFSIDDPVLSFFPDERPTEISDNLAAMRVRHLLTMSTGHIVDTLANMEAHPDANWMQGFFEIPVVHEPGTYFLYNTGATYVLAAIVERTTGMKLLDYLEPRLFAPLGIENVTWQESPQGIAVGGYGLSIRTEDLAKFGQLYLQKGMWQGKRILSETWVDEATSHQIANGDDPYRRDWTQGYGYQFWRSRHGTYRADGVFGQFCIVMPEQDAVLAITAGTDIFDGQQILDLVWDKLIPAMQPEVLPDDPVSSRQLNEKIASLRLPLVQGQAVSELASQISAKTYRVDENPLGLTTISLNFNDTGCVVRLKTAAGDETFHCGYGNWQSGKTTLLNDSRWLSGEPSSVVACGAWTSDDSLTMIVRLYETPFYYTLVYHFAGDEMMIESRVNVSMESTKPLLLMAQRI